MRMLLAGDGRILYQNVQRASSQQNSFIPRPVVANATSTEPQTWS